MHRRGDRKKTRRTKTLWVDFFFQNLRSNEDICDTIVGVANAREFSTDPVVVRCLDPLPAKTEIFCEKLLAPARPFVGNNEDADYPIIWTDFCKMCHFFTPCIARQRRPIRQTHRPPKLSWKCRSHHRRRRNFGLPKLRALFHDHHCRRHPGRRGGWGVYACEVIPVLRAMDGEGKTILIRINSYGGDVFEGLAIANTIAALKAHTIVEVIGMAASIASIITIAADEVRIYKSAEFMIHRPWALVIGNADDMRDSAAHLDKIQGQLVEAYVDRSAGKKDRATIADPFDPCIISHGLSSGRLPSSALGGFDKEGPDAAVQLVIQAFPVRAHLPKKVQHGEAQGPLVD